MTAVSAPTGLEVQRVQILWVSKAENACEAEQAVENENQGIVCCQQLEDPGLVADGSDQTGHGVVAHEGIDAHTKQVGYATEVAHVWVALALSLGQTDHGENDHHAECCRGKHDRH